MLKLFQFTYNEEILIKFINTQWIKNIPSIKIQLVDNQSTDKTVEIAKSIGCEVVKFNTKNQFSDETHMNLANSIPYKPEYTDFCGVVDLDELVLITEEDLIREKEEGTTIIRTEGWQLFSLERHIGTRMPRFDKFCIINPNKVTANWGAGRHEIFPKGEIKYSKKVYKLYHFGMFDEEYYINRRKIYSERWSEKNLKMGWGAESRLNEQELREKYRKLKEKAIKII